MEKHSNNNVVTLPDNAKIGMLYIYRCDGNPYAQDAEWHTVLPKDVPEGLLDPEILGEMVSGMMAQLPGDTCHYRATEVSHVSEGHS